MPTQREQEGGTADPGSEPRHIAIWTDAEHYWLCREATTWDLDGDLIERDGRLFVIIGSGCAVPSSNSA